MIDTTFDRSLGEEGVQKALRRICTAAEKAIGWGYQILVRPLLPASCLILGPNPSQNAAVVVHMPLQAPPAPRCAHRHAEVFRLRVHAACCPTDPSAAWLAQSDAGGVTSCKPISEYQSQTSCSWSVAGLALGALICLAKLD